MISLWALCSKNNSLNAEGSSVSCCALIWWILSMSVSTMAWNKSESTYRLVGLHASSWLVGVRDSSVYSALCLNMRPDSAWSCLWKGEEIDAKRLLRIKGLCSMTGMFLCLSLGDTSTMVCWLCLWACMLILLLNRGYWLIKALSWVSN